MERIHKSIDRFMRTGEGDFESLALTLFAYQFKNNGPYRAFCEAQDATPDSIHRWENIPAVPVAAFKSAELAAFPAAQAAAIFHSNATTTGTPSRHFIKDLHYYETSLKASFRKWVMPQPATGAPLPWREGNAKRDLKVPIFILTSSPAEAPHSSLSWMMDVVKRTWGDAGSEYFVRNGRLDEPRLVRMIQKAEQKGPPIMVLGTTIAFLTLFDYLSGNKLTLKLPAGSRIMDTGGMKTIKRDLTRAHFVVQATAVFGISQDSCINEYGMCELGSQFYGKGTSAHFEGPPWVRTLVRDPLTGQIAQAGRPGRLCHFDLANIDSVMSIQTEDMGMKPSSGLRRPAPDTGEGFTMPSLSPGAGPHSGGEGFDFIGRDANAELKGCSLAAERLNG